MNKSGPLQFVVFMILWRGEKGRWTNPNFPCRIFNLKYSQCSMLWGYITKCDGCRMSPVNILIPFNCNINIRRLFFKVTLSIVLTRQYYYVHKSKKIVYLRCKRTIGCMINWSSPCFYTCVLGPGSIQKPATLLNDIKENEWPDRNVKEQDEIF